MNVVITAEGIVSAIGIGEAEVLESLRSGKSGIGKMRYLDSIHKDLPVGEVKMSNEEMMAKLGIEKEENVSRNSMLAIMAIKQFEDTLPKRDDYDEDSYILVSGTSVGTMDKDEQYNLKEKLDRPCLGDFDMGCSKGTSDVWYYFDFLDRYVTISTACSSAANAILLGADMIRAHMADVVVAGGTESLTKFHLNGFNSLMILDKERCRPFDATRAGLNLGEGAAYVVLESEEHAKARGAEIHAYLSGYGNACDAFHQTASSEDGEGAYLAMSEALDMAGLKPFDVQYVNAHGTGTPNNDQSESVALRRIFGNKMPWVSSTKSFTGHTTSASGGIEAVISILALRHQFVPANLGWKYPMLDGITPSLGENGVELKNVLCNSFGFGGNDTSLLFSLTPPVQDRLNFDEERNVKIRSLVRLFKKEDLTDIHDYLKPMEARRMGIIMKASLLASLKALDEANIKTPDAILTVTEHGCLENSERLLEQMRDSDEEMVSPTLFMQSTHNTIGSNIAIKTHCHGYNMTFCYKIGDVAWASMNADILLTSGRCKSVLVCCYDEDPHIHNNDSNTSKSEVHRDFKCMALVLTLEDKPRQ